jgi:NAD(P)-dependent dehydrogenase (short-subunit alcohol dehydrogenase family)
MLRKVKDYISKQFIFPAVQLEQGSDLEGVVAIVTGASKGIGKACVETLLAQGASVAAAARTMESLSEAYPEKQDRLFLVATDVRLEAEVEKLVTQTVSHFGKVDVLVNNAGINIESPLENMSLADFHSVMETCVTGTFLTCRAVLPRMKSAGSGLIVNIGSKISHNTNVRPNKVIYATAKSALESFSFALNKELKHTGVRVVCLMPGTVNTFVSTHAKDYMSPYEVAALVVTTIKHKTIDFEGIIFKSANQDI